MIQNNIFSYATKELSQDAFLCWLANWYNYDESPLKELAEVFIRKILTEAKVEVKSIDTVEVLKQYKKIDVLLIVNKSIAIVIEDKTKTSEHDKQIERYKREIETNGIYTETIKYKADEIKNIICVFLKTYEYNYFDDALKRNEKIVNIDRACMLELCSEFRDKSEILDNYYAHLLEIDKRYKSLESEYKSNNYNNCLADIHFQWRLLKDIFGEDSIFSSVNKLPGDHEAIEIEGNNGAPYTWYWLNEFSTDIKEDDENESLKKKYGRFIAFRVNSTSISLRMYRNLNYPALGGKSKLGTGQNEEYLRLRNKVKEILKEKSEQYSSGIEVIEVNKREDENYIKNDSEIFMCTLKDKIISDNSMKALKELLKAICDELKKWNGKEF